MADKPSRFSLTRRQLLAAGLGAATTLLPWRAHARTSGRQLLSPASFKQQFVLARLDQDLKPDLNTGMPFRGHGLRIDPLDASRALIIARRPGTQAIEVDLSTGEVTKIWQSEDDRHFYGHACFSRDGKTVFTTENNIDTGDGIVSVRDAQTFRVLDEYPSYGIGPHELLMMPDGVTLVVANGGIKTFPETGRVKLNRGRIVSSLAYIDSRTGKLAGLYEVPVPQSSLRHLAVSPDGLVAGAMQYEGSQNKAGQPLLVFHRGESALQIADAPVQAWKTMSNYAASVAYDSVSGHFAISCPLGDTVALWNAQRAYEGLVKIPKASGIVFNEESGFVSNESGEIYLLDMKRFEARVHASLDNLQWDNHLYSR